jgi:transcriptional regulator with XRE-family HTH domain
MKDFMLNLPTWYTRLQSLREDDELTQTQFAKALGVSKQQLARYETGRTEPSIDFWKKIAKRYNKLNIAWVLFGIDPKEKRPSVGSEQLNLFPSETLEIEFQRRTQIANSLFKKINQSLEKIQEENLSKMSLTALRERLKNEALMMIPQDAPDWLRDDIKKKLAIWLE